MQPTPARSILVLRVACALSLVAACALARFAYWGMYTVEGRRSYDEMDGIFPFAAAVLSAMLVIVAATLWWLGRWIRARRGGRGQSTP